MGSVYSPGMKRKHPSDVRLRADQVIMLFFQFVHNTGFTWLAHSSQCKDKYLDWNEINQSNEGNWLLSELNHHVASLVLQRIEKYRECYVCQKRCYLCAFYWFCCNQVTFLTPGESHWTQIVRTEKNLNDKILKVSMRPNQLYHNLIRCTIHDSWCQHNMSIHVTLHMITYWIIFFMKYSYTI